MSHYTVAVFTKNKHDSIEKLLAPYDENIQVAPYVERTKAQIIQYERDELQKNLTDRMLSGEKTPQRINLIVKIRSISPI